MYFLYLWNMQELIKVLKTSTLPRWKMRWYCILNPLLTIMNSLFFTILLLTHRFVAEFFEDLMTFENSTIPTYTTLFILATAATICITIFGFLTCYLTNRKGDNKDFFYRMSCLNFTINFHLTVYTLAILAVLSFIGVAILYHKVDVFQHNLAKEGSLMGIIPFFFKLVGAPIGSLGSEVPTAIKNFILDTRATLLSFYPFIAFLPPSISLCNYILIRRMLRKIAYPE